MNSETHRSAWWISLTGRQVKLQWSAGQLNIYTRSVSKFFKNTLKIRLCLNFSRRGGGGGGGAVGGGTYVPSLNFKHSRFVF